MIKQDGKNYYAFGETMKLCGISESRLNHIVKVYIPKGSLKVPGLDHLKGIIFQKIWFKRLVGFLSLLITTK